MNGLNAFPKSLSRSRSERLFPVACALHKPRVLKIIFISQIKKLTLIKDNVLLEAALQILTKDLEILQNTFTCLDAL